jgi:hypothetical protein
LLCSEQPFTGVLPSCERLLFREGESFSTLAHGGHLEGVVSRDITHLRGLPSLHKQNNHYSQQTSPLMKYTAIAGCVVGVRNARSIGGPQTHGGLRACLAFGDGRAFRAPVQQKAPPGRPGRALQNSGLAPKLRFDDDAEPSRGPKPRGPPARATGVPAPGRKSRRGYRTRRFHPGSHRVRRESQFG